jgi:hypothetical protein
VRKSELRTKLTECQHRAEQLLGRNQALRGLVASLHAEVSACVTALEEAKAVHEADVERIALLEAALDDLAEATPDPPTPIPPTIPTGMPGPPQAPPGWRTVKTLAKRADWNSVLIEAFSGASITDTSQGLRVWVPGPQTADGGRAEVQAYHGVEGQKTAYEYGILIPQSTVLSNAYPNAPKNLLAQHHGDQAAGFTGGVSVYPNGQISLRVKGGNELSLAGSHPYQYENEVIFGSAGAINRGVWHRIRIEVLWHRSDGWARARLNDGLWYGVDGVPTWPLGNADGVPTTKIMYRHGLYPQGGIVQGPMEVYYSPCVFQVAA